MKSCFIYILRQKIEKGNHTPNVNAGDTQDLSYHKDPPEFQDPRYDR